MQLTANEYTTVLRCDLAAFIERSFVELNPQTRFLPNWHLEVLAAKLEACRRGACRRLIINMPPRSLKSLSVTVAYSAYLLGHHPAAHIIAVSYGQELSDKFARDTRQVMLSDWYQALFPTRLSTQRQAVQDFMTTAGGSRLATSVGGVLTGRGADVLIVDDAMKPEEARSATQRRTVLDWYDTTLYSRLNDKEKGVIILVMHRLHEEDLVGHVLAQEPWEVVSFPAIPEQDTEYEYETPYGTARHRRRRGDVLHPERESRETLERLRQTMGGYNFAGQYQQSPVPEGGGMVKLEWFKIAEPRDLPDVYDQIVQSWDTACKDTELSDFSVCTTWGIHGSKRILLHVLRKRMNYPELKRAVREQADLHRATVVLIEDKASGTQLIQELVSDGLSIVKGIEPAGDKIMRMHAQTATIENGFVYLPREAHWLPAYLHELTTFPKGAYDDQVDSTSQALAWIRQGEIKPEPAILTYYRELHEKLMAGPFGKERLCAHCNKPIDPRNYHEQGDRVYHPECLQARWREGKI
jgi:predicted phage terminase large subunit-like protein